MPISAHSDLLAINAFPDLIYKEHVVDILSYSKENVHREGFSYYPPLTYFTIGLLQFPYHLFSDTFSPWMTQLRVGFINDIKGQAVDYIARYLGWVGRMDKLKIWVVNHLNILQKKDFILWWRMKKECYEVCSNTSKFKRHVEELR